MKYTPEQLKEMAKQVQSAAGTMQHAEFMLTLAAYCFGGNVAAADQYTERLANA